MTFIKKLTLFFIVSMITLSSTFSSSAAENKSTEAKDKPQAKWVASNGRWWYDKGDGTYGKSEFIDGYWLDEDGWYVSGWYGKWYQDKSGWWYQSGTWYPRNSWQKIDGSWYYFDANGYMAHSRWLKSGRYWYYLTDTVAIIKKSGLKINALPVEDNNEILGVNTIPQLKEAEEIMKARLGDEK